MAAIYFIRQGEGEENDRITWQTPDPVEIQDLVERLPDLVVPKFLGEEFPIIQRSPDPEVNDVSDPQHVIVKIDPDEEQEDSPYSRSGFWLLQYVMPVPPGDVEDVFPEQRSTKGPTLNERAKHHQRVRDRMRERGKGRKKPI